MVYKLDAVVKVNGVCEYAKLMFIGSMWSEAERRIRMRVTKLDNVFEGRCYVYEARCHREA